MRLQSGQTTELELACLPKRMLPQSALRDMEERANFQIYLPRRNINRSPEPFHMKWAVSMETAVVVSAIISMSLLQFC